MRDVSALLILLLAGCKPETILVKPQPIDARCEPECFVACASNLIYPRWLSSSTDGTGTADELYAAFNADKIVFQIAAKELEACDSRREVCARCLTSLHEAGVIGAFK